MMLIYCKCVCIEGAILEREKRKKEEEGAEDSSQGRFLEF